jgi:hypothetical protein
MGIDCVTQIWTAYSGFPNLTAFPSGEPNYTSSDPLTLYVLADKSYRAIPQRLAPGNYIGRSTISFQAFEDGVFTISAQQTGGIRFFSNDVFINEILNTSGQLSSLAITATAGQQFTIVVEHDGNVFSFTGPEYIQIKGILISAQTDVHAPVRVTFSEDTSQLLVGTSLSASFLPTESFKIGQQVSLGDALDPAPLYGFRVASVRREGPLVTITGRSLLTRLQQQRMSAFILRRGTRTDTDGTLFFYPEDALEIILTAAGVPHITPIPVMALKGPDGPIRPKLAAITITWDTTTTPPALPPTIADVLVNFFDPFFYSGYVFRSNNLDQLEVKSPAWMLGNTIGVTLTDDDILMDGWTISEDDSKVINLCTVRSNGWDFQDDQRLAPDAIFDNGPTGDLGLAIPVVLIDRDDYRTDGKTWSATVLYDIGDAVDFSGLRYRKKIGAGVGVHPTGDATSATYWETSPKNGFTDLGTKLSSNTWFLPFTDGFVTDNGDVKLDVDIFFSGINGVGGRNSGHDLSSITLPADGTPVNVTHGINRGLFYVPQFIYDTFIFRKTVAGVQVQSSRYPIPTPTSDGPYWIAYRVSLRARGKVWKQSNITSTGIYGEASDDATSPGLSASRAAFDVRDKTLNLGVYTVDAATCQEIARSIVEANLNPHKLHQITLVPPWKARPSNLNNLVKLPDESVGTFEARQYQESNAPGQSVSGASIRVREDNVLVPPAALVSASGTVLVTASGKILMTKGS